ncbi:imm11 family protein [Archangium gephyra]|uniref:imm11 family protein n=1 Tax=Archangium gephyra TaxID=48 RepID=UPI003B7A9CEE
MNPTALVKGLNPKTEVSAKSVPRYYELRDDVYHPGRWHLRHPVDEHGQKINPWQFSEGKRLDAMGTIRFPVRPDGVELDFSWDSFSIPLVNSRFIQCIEQLGIQEVQFLPVQVDGHAGPYFILNALRILRCIDDARCAEVKYFTPDDGQPEKIGEYKYVRGMRIDPAKTEGARVLRPWGWTLSLIVSEDLKQALEREGLTGTRFTEV